MSSTDEQNVLAKMGSSGTIRLSAKPVFGVPLTDLIPDGHSPPIHLVRILAKLETSRGFETPRIFLERVDIGRLTKLISDLRQGQFGSIMLENDPHVLASLVLVWLDAIPEGVIPVDMYAMFFEAEKIDGDPEFLFHYVQTLVNCLPRANRTILQFVCYMLQHVVARSTENQVTLEVLAKVVAPIVLKPRKVGARLVFHAVNAAQRVQRFTQAFQEGLRDFSSWHYDDLPPLLEVDGQPSVEGEALAALRDEYDRRLAAALPGERIITLCVERFVDLFTNEGNAVRFTNKTGADARDVLSAGTMKTVFYKLVDKNYVDMLDPEFPLLALQMRIYFMNSDADLVRRFHDIYLRHKGTRVQWRETIRLRILNTMKMFFEAGIPPGGAVAPEFAAAYQAFCEDLDEESQVWIGFLLFFFLHLSSHICRL